MNFNDKFLNICFKLGKFFFSILLLIALVVSLVFWIKTGISYYKINEIKQTYEYDVKDIVYQNYALDFGLKQEEKTPPAEQEKKQKVDKNVKKAAEEYEKYAKDNNVSYWVDLSVVAGDDITSKQKAAMIYKAIEFHKAYRKEFVDILKKATKLSDNEVENIIRENSQNLFNDAAKSFLDAAKIEKEVTSVLKQGAEQQKQANLFIALISLGIFTLFLFLPILIRIEENTRKKD